MAVKLYKPTTATRRFSSVSDWTALSGDGKRPKTLTFRKSARAGRNHSGKITVRHRGGGAKKVVRTVDFSRGDRFSIPAKVQAISYDPTRSAFIALLAYRDGVKRYMLAPIGLRLGQEIIFSDTADIRPGNRLKLANIPVGSLVHDIELVPGQGGKVARSAGGYAILQTLEAGFALLKLPSGEVRKVRAECGASIGQLGNQDWMNVRLGKAGRSRHMGRRPEVRGKVMNPVDHPHGGGEGVNPIGLKYPKTPWGKHALGVKTREKKKGSSKLILKRRLKK